MSKSPCHTHNNACVYWTTPRNDWIANVSISAPIFVLQEPPRSHPTSVASTQPSLTSCVCLGLPWPAVHTFRAWVSPAGRWGRGSWGVFGGAVLLGPMCAALSSDVPPKGGRGSTGAQRCLLHFCHCYCCPLLVARFDVPPPELGRLPPQGGGVGVRVAQRYLLLRPLCSLAPHLCVVRATSAKYTQRGTSHPSALSLYIYVYTP